MTMGNSAHTDIREGRTRKRFSSWGPGTFAAVEKRREYRLYQRIPVDSPCRHEHAVMLPMVVCLKDCGPLQT